MNPPLQHAKTMAPQRAEELNFDVMEDPDYPAEAVNSNVIVEEIEMNGLMQKIYKKTYTMIDGKTINITRMEQAWFTQVMKRRKARCLAADPWAEERAREVLRKPS